MPPDLYDVRCELDLPPPFGRVAHVDLFVVTEKGPSRLFPTDPGRLKEWAKAMLPFPADTRRELVRRMSETTEDGEVLVPALLPLLRDADSELRVAVLETLARHPAAVADRYPAILERLGDSAAPAPERIAAANLLAATAPPKNKDVEGALRRALLDGDRATKAELREALQRYRSRRTS